MSWFVQSLRSAQTTPSPSGADLQVKRMFYGPCGREKEKIDNLHRYAYSKTWRLSMNTVTVSSKFQVVIPKEIREDVGLKVGTTMEVITYGSRIELVPIQPINNLKGKFKGISTGIEREDDRL